MAASAVVVMFCALARGAAPTEPVPCSGECSTLTLESGVVEGEVREGVTHFLGIPFAKAPVGDLRWQPPQPPAPWTEPRKAHAYSHACMQSASIYGDFTDGVSEDCLYLNMWVPAAAGKAPAAAYPVMIFFHGGSYISGTANIPVYGGQADVRAYNDVILIAANYRLGVFGYLGSEHLRAADNSTGNFGFQDQRRVMQWVRDNAAAFHGDPDRVLIFGESAGAGSVSAHLVAPRSGGLFHRAIMESGPTVAQWVAQPMSVAEHQFAKLAATMNCSGPSVATCLRALNATVIQAHRPTCANSLLEWAPTIDGVELSAHPRKLLEDGLAHDVPVILGTNRDEGTLFIDISTTANESTYNAHLLEQFGPQLGAQVAAQYPPSRFNATKDGTAEWWAMASVFGDVAMTCAAHRTAEALAATPGRKSPVYLYAFEHELDWLSALDWVAAKHAYGCCHASELALVFDVDEILIGNGERDLALGVVRHWTTLATNGTASEGWPAWEAASPTVLVWDVVDGKASFTPSTTIKESDTAFWESRYDEVPETFFYGACYATSK